MMQPVFLFNIACATGIGVHLVFFVRGEWERYAPKVAQLALLAESVLIVWAFTSTEFSIWDALISVMTLNLGLFAGLFGSIITYRLILHPLRAYPGPVGAKLSGFYSMGLTLGAFQLHKSVQSLHQTYGDFVRIRPREISISHVDAIRDIHGPTSKCVKGPFYDLNYPSRSLQMTRDKKFHSTRKRVWEKGLSSSALTDYEPRVLEHCKKFLTQLSKHTTQAVEITEWLNYFGFDVMGDLAFGKSFDMLTSGKAHFIMAQMQAAGPLVAALICVPWLFIVFQSLPLISAKRAENVAWCGKQVEERKLMGKSRLDLFSYLLLSSKDDPRHPTISDGDLIYDSELAIVAGSDTTSTTLAAVVFLLAKHPEKQRLLAQEIDRLVPSLDDFSYGKLVGKSPYLDGCINEALRLYPAVPSGVQRLTPPEGAMIAGQMIPGDTIVSTPTYSIHRDSRYFMEPASFIPERWSSMSNMVSAKEALNSFLVGPYSCVGKNLAMMEMRMLVCFLVKSFSFQFPDREKDEIVDRFESGYRDCFTGKAQRFEVVLSKREETI